MIEICIQAEAVAGTRAAVRAAYDGGADRVELCRAMELDGLTPKLEVIRSARLAFGGRTGLVVMVRPRGGDFVYTLGELRRMERAIERAKSAGANGVALGVLRAGNLRIDTTQLKRLVRAAGEAGLQVTFHRAFDAAPDADEALEALVDSGVKRVLTAGIMWGAKGGALDGLPRLRRTLERADGRLEVVVAGGVSPANAGTIVAGLAGAGGLFSLHAYSGVREKGETRLALVKELVRNLNRVDRFVSCHSPDSEA